MDQFYSQFQYCQLRMFTQSSYLDFNDLDSPLKKKGDMNFINILKNGFTRSTLNMVQNNYTIEDSVIFSSYNHGAFYNIERKAYSVGTELYQNNAGFLGVIKLELGEIKNQYDVKIYNFYDLIAQIGGLYEVCFESIGLFAFYITKKMFEYSLINKMSDNLQDLYINESSSNDNLIDSNNNISPNSNPKKISPKQVLHQSDRI